jgi:hypothetical protein
MRATGLGIDSYSPRVGAKAAAPVGLAASDSANGATRGSGAGIVSSVSSGVARVAKPSVFDLRGV